MVRFYLKKSDFQVSGQIFTRSSKSFSFFLKVISFYQFDVFMGSIYAFNVIIKYTVNKNKQRKKSYIPHPKNVFEVQWFMLLLKLGVLFCVCLFAFIAFCWSDISLLFVRKCPVQSDFGLNLVRFWSDFWSFNGQILVRFSEFLVRFSDSQHWWPSFLLYNFICKTVWLIEGDVAFFSVIYFYLKKCMEN